MTIKLEIELGSDAERIIALLQRIANLSHLAIQPSPPPEASPRHPREESSGRLFFGEKELARQLNVSAGVLHKWRMFGTVPNFVKIGRLVRYRQSDVDEWIAIKRGGGSGNGRD
jgi:predicted DNA-binding transcriptional regulator AlpA